jgi:hypothetical protein
MRRFLAGVAVLVVVASSSIVTADEGMWMPEQLPELGQELTARGLALDPAQLADLEGQPLGAVVWLGGCTGSFVSPQGLVITNHHCAYGSLQYNSSPENNILEQGFLAGALDQELPASPGSRIYVALETSDVTGKVLGSIPADAGGAARHAAIEKAEKELVAECEQDPGHRCRVSSYYGGMVYVLTRQLEIRDVRLVYAPAAAIGNYGGDIDNWMWPRHTGDFSFLRAYVGPDGKAADPSPDNVPYQPRHWLPVSTEGVAEGDLVMVAGYPGSTDRYRLADEVQATFEWRYPTRLGIIQEMLEIIGRETEGRPEAAMAYAATTSYMNNGLKNNQGMLAGYAHSDMLARKRALEQELAAWIDADPERRQGWGGKLAELRLLVAEDQVTRDRDLLFNMMKRGLLLGSAQTLVRLVHERQLPDAEREPGFQDRDLDSIKARLMRIDRSFDARVDQALFKAMLLRFAALPAAQRVAALDQHFGLAAEPFDPASLDTRLAAMYAGTTLTDQEQRLGWMTATPQELAESNDPFLVLALALYPETRRWEERDDAMNGRIAATRPLVMEALVAYLKGQGRTVYPDANSTLRVTYGTVSGYQPRDAVQYKAFTTGNGILEKETGEPPFSSPAPLLAALRGGDFAPYTLGSGNVLPVDFLSSVDTTGGNSGSPTLDGHGRLVGLLFDGNWESMISDWDFLPEVTRSIHVDIRYVLWVMNRVDGADNLLQEMGLEEAPARR